MTKEISISTIEPLIIIHGGAGNIRRENLPVDSYKVYQSSLLQVLHESSIWLSRPDATALDVATHAVKLLEDDPLYNCGKGAVFTRAGTVELESSVMVSKGYRKRGVGCMTLKHVKNPILLAKEMLIRGEQDDGGGAGAHSQLSGEELERLAASWGLDIVEQSYFFTKRRWDEHKHGLGKAESTISQEPGGLDGNDGNLPWDGHEYLPQGTVGAVVLDRFGTICVATSTGGLTNKLPGRIGDTPTLGAGFWAEEWRRESSMSKQMIYRLPPQSMSPLSTLHNLARDALSNPFTSCLPLSAPSLADECRKPVNKDDGSPTIHAVGMSGTGNGDSFLRTSAVRTAASISRFSSPPISLSEAVKQIAGPGGELQQSAGDRWGKTGEGEGGIIGIELRGSKGEVVWDFNCGGMFRAWIDDDGRQNFEVFREKY
jgi:L-asparaginase